MTVSAASATLDLAEPLTSEAILDNVRAILPIVDEEAAETSAIGHMTARMEETLRATGAYRVGFSRRRGGPEMTLLDQMTMVELVAEHDASIAWNVAVLAATGYYGSRLGDEAFAELYPSLDSPTCGSFHPKARAVEVAGGYLVSGDWKFGSGIHSSEQIVGGCEIIRDGEILRKSTGVAEAIGVWLPRAAVTIHDDWHTVGLRGSGSSSYSVRDVFVPASHSFDRFFTPDAAADPLSKHVDLPFYSMIGLSTGIASHAVTATLAHLGNQAKAGRPAGERVHVLLGEAITLVRAAKTIAREGMAAIDRAIFEPGGMPDEATLARGDAPLVTEFARRVLDLCVDAYGSAAIYEAHPLEKLVRDLAGVSVHASTTRNRWIGIGASALSKAASAS